MNTFDPTAFRNNALVERAKRLGLDPSPLYIDGSGLTKPSETVSVVGPTIRQSVVTDVSSVYPQPKTDTPREANYVPMAVFVVGVLVFALMMKGK